MKKRFISSFVEAKFLIARCLTLLILALLSANFAWGAVQTTATAANGKSYIIAAYSGEKYYALPLITNATTYNGTEITLNTNGKVTAVEGLPIWTLTENNSISGQFYITYEDNSTTYYLYKNGTSGTNYNIKGSTSDKNYWSFTKTSDGNAYNIVAINRGTNHTYLNYYSSKFQVRGTSASTASNNNTSMILLEVEEDSRVLKTLRVSGTPDKKTYEVGEEFDPAGLVVTGTYTEGEPEVITSGITWTFDPATFTSTSQTSVSVTATVGEVSSEAYTVNGLTVNAIEGDRLTLASTGVSGNSYTEWTGKTGSEGIAVYAGKSAGSYSSIQLNATSPNGLVSTTSGGLIRKVKVDWNTNTSSTGNRSIDIYGSNTAYTGSGDIYKTEKQGTKLGSIVCGTSTELEVEGDYEYVGIRAIGGALYMNSITFVWSAPKVLESIAVKTAPTVVNYAAGEFFNPAGLVITATYDDESTKDITYEGNEDKFSFSPALDAALATTDEKVTITYGGKSCDQTITVKNIELTEITLSGGYPTEFWKGDAFSHEGMTVTAHYYDESTKDVTSSATFSGYDMATLGEQEVTVTYEGMEAKYNITVKTIANTKETAYTVAEAKTIIDANPAELATTEVYVKGIVSEIVTAWSSLYNNITYNISEDGETTSQQFQLYRCETNGAVAGDYVIAKGTMKKFGETYELSAGNTIVNAANMTITAAKWGTFCAPFDVELEEGVKAYKADANGSNVTFTEVITTIPAGTPVVVYSAETIDKNYFGALAEEETCTSGALVGVYAATSGIPAIENGNQNYVLQNNAAGVGFYKVAEGSTISLKANRCYMTLPTSSAAKDGFSFEEIITGINEILNPTKKSAEGIFDLNGRKLAAPQKGINIINGVKVIVK